MIPKFSNALSCSHLFSTFLATKMQFSATKIVLIFLNLIKFLIAVDVVKLQPSLLLLVLAILSPLQSHIEGFAGQVPPPLRNILIEIVDHASIQSMNVYLSTECDMSASVDQLFLSIVITAENSNKTLYESL